MWPRDLDLWPSDPKINRDHLLYRAAAYQNPDSDQNKIRKALTTLKKATEQAAKQLGILKKLAEEKNKEELWNLVNKSIKINEGAREGADYGLSILSESSKKKDNR